MGVFTFLKFYKWYKIAERISYLHFHCLLKTGWLDWDVSYTRFYYCMLLSCHVQVSEWIHTLYFAWMSRNSLLWSLSDSKGIQTHNHLVHKRTLNHLAKGLSVRLPTKGLWVWIPLLSLFYYFTLFVWRIFHISIKWTKLKWSYPVHLILK